jgi:hypothetical protein
METFHALMAGKTEHYVDRALKLGATLAEVGLSSLSCSLPDIFSAGTDVKASNWASQNHI